MKLKIFSLLIGIFLSEIAFSDIHSSARPLMPYYYNSTINENGLVPEYCINPYTSEVAVGCEISITK